MHQQTQKLAWSPGSGGTHAGGGGRLWSLHRAPSRPLSCQPQGSRQKGPARGVLEFGDPDSRTCLPRHCVSHREPHLCGLLNPLLSEERLELQGGGPLL